MSDEVVDAWQKYRKQAKLGKDGDESDLYEHWAKRRFGGRLGQKLSDKSRGLKAAKAKDSGGGEPSEKKKGLSLTGKLKLRKLETELWSTASKSKKAKLKAQIAKLKGGGK